MNESGCMLEAFPVAQTSHVDVASGAVGDHYLPNVLTRISSDLDMTLNLWGSHDFTIGWLTYGSQVRLEMPPSTDYYHLNLTLAGRTRGMRGDRATGETSAGSSGLVLVPDETTVVDWSADAAQLIVRVSRTRLEEHAASLLGEHTPGPIDFDFGVDLSCGTGATLLDLAQMAAREINHNDAFAINRLALTQMEDMVLTGLLLGVGSSLRDPLLEPQPRMVSSQLGRLLEFIESSLAEPLAVSDLARAAHMSRRAVYLAFQENLDVSPMAYVRGRRLARVRDALLSADAAHQSISEIAFTWGFTHPSRFASQYAREFGELPSDTRRRVS